jgi:hypothetical protein
MYDKPYSPGSNEFVGRGAPYDWRAYSEMEARSDTIPHCKVTVLNDTMPEEPLRRSEVLLISKYMEWRMTLWRYRSHEIFPVCELQHFLY